MGSIASAVGLIRIGVLGSREPSHLRRWAMAGVRARAAISCVAVAATGAPCRNSPLRGASVCIHHIRDRELRARLDAERRARAEARIAKGFPAARVERARATIAALDKRALHQNWKIDARIEGATIAFVNETDRRACLEWLRRECAVDLELPLPATRRMASPRMVDRCLWASWRVIRGGDFVSDDFVKRARWRVNAAIKDERKFWNAWDAAGGPEEEEFQQCLQSAL